MRYWKIEVSYPIWVEDTICYFEAENEDSAREIANDLMVDISEEAYYQTASSDEDSDDYMEIYAWVDQTNYNLFEVSYEEAKEYL